MRLQCVKCYLLNVKCYLLVLSVTGVSQDKGCTEKLTKNRTVNAAPLAGAVSCIVEYCCIVSKISISSLHLFSTVNAESRCSDPEKIARAPVQ